MTRDIVATRGTVVFDPEGKPAFEFVEDVFRYDPVMLRSIIELPSRKHPEPGTLIPKWFMERFRIRV